MKNFAASLFKSAGIPINRKLIESVNHSIDNDSIMGLALSSYMGKRNKLNQYHGLTKNPYDLFGIVNGGGHRSKNHDMLSGLFLAAMNARAMKVPASHAMLATMAHFASDSMSNRMVSKMGVEGRNMWEALFNFQTRRNKSKSIF
jgi:hypothetical protein